MDLDLAFWLVAFFDGRLGAFSLFFLGLAG